MTATAAKPRIVVLDSFAIDQGEPETTWRELAELGELVVHPQTEPAEVGAHARDAIAVLTNKVALSAADLQALPQVRYVGVTATGTNVVDLAAARAAGIAVTNVPGIRDGLGRRAGVRVDPEVRVRRRRTQRVGQGRASGRPGRTSASSGSR